MNSRTTNQEKVQTILPDILLQYRRFRLSVAAVIALLVIALICAFFNRYATFALLVLALAFHLLYVRKQQNAYTRSVSHANISLTVMPRLGAEDVSYEGAGGFTASLIKRAGLMPCDGNPTFFLVSETETVAEFFMGVFFQLFGEELTVTNAVMDKKSGRDKLVLLCPQASSERVLKKLGLLKKGTTDLRDGILPTLVKTGALDKLRKIMLDKRRTSV